VLRIGYYYIVTNAYVSVVSHIVFFSHVYAIIFNLFGYKIYLRIRYIFTPTYLFRLFILVAC